MIINILLQFFKQKDKNPLQNKKRKKYQQQYLSRLQD